MPAAERMRSTFNRGISVEANLDLVEMVEDEFGRVSAEILDGIRFGIGAAVDVHSDEVISENTLENAPMSFVTVGSAQSDSACRI
jgi:hypothetical protein